MMEQGRGEKRKGELVTGIINERAEDMLRRQLLIHDIWNKGRLYADGE